jgi:hypothetical protein
MGPYVFFWFWLRIKLGRGRIGIGGCVLHNKEGNREDYQ